MLQRPSPHDPWSAGHSAMAMDEAAEHERMRRFRDAALPFLDDVFTLARYLVRDASDAEDAVQECYLRALRHFDSYRGPAMKPWLLAILGNVCNDTFAQRHNQEVPTDYAEDTWAMDAMPLWQEAQASPEGLMLRVQDNDAIHRLIAELPESFREAIVLREINFTTELGRTIRRANAAPYRIFDYAFRCCRKRFARPARTLVSYNIKSIG